MGSTHVVPVTANLHRAELAGRPFERDPSKDPEGLRERFRDPQLGLEGFLRKSFVKVLKRFAELAGPRIMAASPRATLLGNPNVGNIARTEHGVFFTDLDRATRGPAIWDVARFLQDAITLQRQFRLHPSVIDSFEAGYLLGVSRGSASEPARTRSRPP